MLSTVVLICLYHVVQSQLNLDFPIDPPLEIGDVIKITGTGPATINLRVDASNIALHFNMRCDSNVIVRNTMKNGGWGSEERDGGVQLTCDANTAMSMEFTVTETAFEFSSDGVRIPDYDYVHRLDPSTITSIEAHGLNNPVVQVDLFNDHCANLDIDGFLENCSDLWSVGASKMATLQGGIEANAASIQTVATDLGTTAEGVAANAALIASLETSLSTSSEAGASNAASIATLQGEITTLQTTIDERFEGLSAPDFSAQANAGVADAFGADHSNKLFGVDTNTFLAMSLLSNFIMLSFGWCIVSNSRKQNQYHKVVNYSESDAEQPLQRK